MTYYLPLADGKFASFEDTVPRATAHGRVWDYNNPAPPPPPVDKPYTAFGAGIDRTQALVYSALEGIGRATGLEGMADWARGGVESNLADAAKGLTQDQQQSFSDANSVTDYLKATGQAISAIALPTAVGIAGGLAGGALAGPGGALAGALAGGTAAQLPLSYGQHRETQKEANPGQPVNEGAAFLAAVPSAAADAIVDRFTLGIGKAAGISAKAVGAALLPRVAKGIGVGMVSEVPAEVFQEVLDRAQSGQELLSPDAMAAYKESALGAAAVGGVLGGGYAGAFGKRPAAPGTRGEDPGLRGALTEEGATRPPGPPEPTVTLPAAMFSVPGEDTGVGVNTVAAPLKRWLDDYVTPAYPDKLAAAEADALAAHRTATGDPAATLSPEAAATAREAFAVTLADTLLQTSISNEPGRKKAAALQTATDAVVAAEKTLAAVKATPETGDISARLKRNGDIAKAESALRTAQAAKADVETTMANEAAAKQAADDAAAKQAADDAAAADKTFADTLDVAAEQEAASKAARLAEEEEARGDAAVRNAAEQQRAADVEANKRADEYTRNDNARLAAERAEADRVAAAEQQRAANVEANKRADEYTRNDNARLAAERAEADRVAAAKAAQEREQEAQAAQAAQDLADEKAALAAARLKNLAAGRAILAAKIDAERRAAEFHEAARFPGGRPQGSKPLSMEKQFKQNKIDNDAKALAQAEEDAAQARVAEAQAKVDAAQAKVTEARAKAANRAALREGVRATTSSAATTPPLTPKPQRAANVEANKRADEYTRNDNARLAAERAEADRVAAAEAAQKAAQDAAVNQAAQDLADKKAVLAAVQAENLAAGRAILAAKIDAERRAAEFHEAARFPGGRPQGSKPLSMAKKFKQNKIDNDAKALAQAEEDAAQAKEDAAQAEVDKAQANVEALLNAARATRGGQASTRGSTAAPAAGSTPAPTATADPALAAAEATALAARRAKAFEVINDRLEKMRARGAQGAVLADNLEAELKRGVLTPAELYLAFQASSIMAIQLPAGANHDIKFVPRILVTDVSPEALAASGGTGGSTLAGTRTAPPAAGARGLITLSLEPQFASFMQETAAHEAFHVVQDYIASYDQSAARQIDRDFRDDMSLADVEGTLRRKLELASAPTGKSYWAELQKAFGTKTFSSGEMQALVFGALADANRRGVPMTGIKPPYTRLVLALRQFFQRLGGALRGDGFTNTADMLNLLGEGSARRFDAAKSPPGTGTVQASTRAGLSPLHASAVNTVVGYQNVAPRDGILARMGRTISGAGTTSIYGNGVQYEKFWDAIIRNASNVAQPFYILQNTLNRAGKFIGGPDVGRAIEQATMTDTQLDHLVKHGHLRFDPKTRDFTPVANTKGLEQILTPVGSSQDAQDMFQTYSVALRERDHRAAGNAKFFNLSDEEIAATIRESESAHPEWKAVAADLQTFNDSLMDLLVDSGLLERGQADNLKSMFYTPFFRKMEGDAQNAPGQAIGTKMTSAINDPQAFLDKLEGGSGAVEPLYSSLTKNASGILRAVSKNIAMNAATDAMLAGDLAQKKEKASANPGDRTISFYRDGVQEHYFISDPVLWASIASAPAPIRNNMAIFAATIARFTREAITSSPSFHLSNLWKGKVVAYVQEGSPLLGNTLRAVKEAYKNSDAAQAFKISTGFGAEMYGASSADYGKLLARRIRRADGTSSLGDNIANAWEYAQRVSTATELAERLLLREHLMAQGKTAKDAAWQGYLMAPFARGGAGGGFVGSVLVGMMPYIPFLNAKVQGLTRLGQIAADSGGGQKALGVLTSRAITAVAMRGAMLGVFSMAAAMLAQSEEPEKWDRETTERKTNNDIFYIGGKTIYLPRAFEVGFVFGAAPVMIFDALRKGSTEGLAKAFGMGMLNTFGFTALPVPAVIAPLASTVTNFDFLRFAPLTNANLQAKAPEDRFTPTTSGIAKLIGSLPGAGAVGLTPINTQVLLEGYLGTTGIMAINFLSDLGGMVGSSVERPSGAFGSPESIPGLAATLAGFNRFVKTDTQKADKFVTDFYEISRELQQVVRTIHDAQKIGDTARVRQVYEDSRPLLRAKTAITHTADQMSELSSRITQVRQDTRLTTQQKDDLLYNLMSARTTMAQRVVAALRNAGL